MHRKNAEHNTVTTQAPLWSILLTEQLVISLQTQHMPSISAVHYSYHLFFFVLLLC